MADTNFSAGTVISSDWLNDVNALAYTGEYVGTGPIHIEKPTLTPAAVVPDISYGFGAINSVVTRTGGTGQYGNWLSQYLVDTPIPSNQFDVGITSWISCTDIQEANASIFGMWSAANTPSSELAQTYDFGYAVGMEINAGNRWGDEGIQTDVGGTRGTVGLQIVPDIGPALDGATTTTYPGTFALMLGPSIHGHKWWVGTLIRQNTIVATGIAHLAHGGSSAPNAPGAWVKADDYWARGIDFSSATFSTQAILLGASHVISWGGASMNGTSTTLGITTGSTGLGSLYGNGFAQRCIGWSSTGSAPKIGFYDTTPIEKQTGVAVSSAGIHAALVNLGLIAA